MWEAKRNKAPSRNLRLSRAIGAPRSTRARSDKTSCETW